VSGARTGHLVERAVERMADLGTITASATLGFAAPSAGDRNPPPTPDGLADNPAGNNRADAANTAVVTMEMLKTAGLAVAGSQRSRISEEWQVTSGQLLRNMRAARLSNGTASAPAPNLLLVTSSKPKEGKSFSALNLAGSLALGGQSEVLLIDIDSKPGALTATLGLVARRGIFDLIADPALRSEDFILPTAVPGFSFLPIGRAATDGPGSVERTVTRPVVVMIEKLARRYANRVVILDSAACLATSDGSTLAPAMSQIAVVVEAERTQREDLEATLELLKSCPNIMLILNKIRLVTTDAYDDYYYHEV
jgi:protein-tyrosine kinase